jgi:hypothetical protein
MTTISPTVSEGADGVTTVTWAGGTASDDYVAWGPAGKDLASVQVSGTFGSSGTIAIQTSLDNSAFGEQFTAADNKVYPLPVAVKAVKPAHKSGSGYTLKTVIMARRGLPSAKIS